MGIIYGSAIPRAAPEVLPRRLPSGCAAAWMMPNVPGGTLLLDQAQGRAYGLTLVSLGQQASEQQVRSLAYLGNGIVLAGTYSGGKILRSTDSGETWADLGQQFSELSIPALASLGNGVALAGTGSHGHILRSTDSGETWADLGRQLSETYVRSFTSLGNGVVLAGTGDTGHILRSIDNGETWADLGQQFSETRIYALASLGNGVVLAGTGLGGKILRSTDSGIQATNARITGALWVAKRIGTALQFDYVDDYLRAPGDSIGSAITLLCWVCPTSGAIDTPWVIGNGQTHLFVDWVGSANRFGFGRTSATSIYSAAGSVTNGGWQMIAVTSNSAGVSNFYKNGILSGNANQSGGTPAGGGDTYFGNRLDKTKPLGGLLGDVMVVRGVMPQSEIREWFRRDAWQYGVAA